MKQHSDSRPELLAPAGNHEMMRAAIENGADAVYFGLRTLNARMRAGNFDAAELPDVMAQLHERALRGYVCINTLAFPSELETAAQMLLACNEAGVDAVLVQDLGIAALAKQLAPELPLHASTQMTITSPEAIEFLRRSGLNFDRIVAAREMTLDELRLFRARSDVELEVFVHGALCISYSGQCLASATLGGRSANRGECAQPCRLPYELRVDGRAVKDAVAFPLSPRDLGAWDHVPDLARTGITALKIEGRLKSPEYVAAVVRCYRKLIDTQTAALPSDIYELEMAYSRGFTPGYLAGIDDADLVDGRSSRSQGALVGAVESVQSNGVRVRLHRPVSPGDGVAFSDQGGSVYEVIEESRRGEHIHAQLRFGPDGPDLRKIKPGQEVRKTSDPKLDRELRATYASGKVSFRRPIYAHVQGAPGQPLQLTLADDCGHTVTVQDELPAEAAGNQPLTEAVLRQQLSRLGNTPFVLQELEVKLDGDILVPFARLNQLRRRAVEQLLEQRRHASLGRQSHPDALETMRAAIVARGVEQSAEPELHVLCRSLEQVDAVAHMCQVRGIYIDFETLEDHARAAEVIRAAGKRFAPATPRILHPGEERFVTRLLDLSPDALLVRNLAAAQLAGSASSIPLIGDASLNVANDITATTLINAGFSHITPAVDLDLQCTKDLLRRVPPQWLEVAIHQHVPMFHTRFCLHARYLTESCERANCDRGCDHHDLALHDRKGYDHPVKTDPTCRTIVYNAVPQSAARHVRYFRKAGVSRYRLELLDHSPDQTRELVHLYDQLLSGQILGDAAWACLQHQGELTQGFLR